MLPRQVLVQVSGEDLRRNYDDPMLAIIEAFVTRATEIQRKAKGKKEFYKVDLTIFGMDQAAIIERRHPSGFPPGLSSSSSALGICGEPAISPRTCLRGVRPGCGRNLLCASGMAWFESLQALWQN